MAAITRENLGNLHDKVKVTLAKEDYLPAFEKSLKSYARNTNIPGFRKGMVPSGMLKKMYGQNIFTEEVLRTAGRKIEEYIVNEKVEIFAQPMIMRAEQPLELDMNKPQDVDFEFEIGLKPDIEIPALNDGTTLKKYKVQVGDAMLNDEIERIQKRFGNMEDMTKVTDKEDVITASIIRTNEEGTPNDGATEQEVRFVVDRLPAQLQEEWKDAPTGTEKIFRPIDVATAEELKGFVSGILKSDELANEGYFKISIKHIGSISPKELDVTLFGEVFPQDNITTEEEFRNRLRKELSKEFDRMAQERLNNEIFELLVHQTPIELPVAFLKRWLKEGQEKPKTEEEVEQEYPGFDHQLRWTLISDKIIRDNKLEVSREDVMNHIKGQLLAHFGMQPDDEAPWMDSYMRQMEKDSKTLDETYRRLIFDQVFEFLNGKFAIQEEEVDEETFFKLPDPHAAHHHHH